MKKIGFWAFVLITFFLCVSIGYADTIMIPFQCDSKKIQAKFKKVGIKLEINGDNKHKDSWGFIDNKGTYYNIVTYNQVSIEELNNITKLVMEK